MKFLMKHPRTGRPDLMGTLVLLVVAAAAIKFILDGVTLVLFGHSISFGHSDPMTYGTLLTPVLGSHSYINTRTNTTDPLASNDLSVVDDPDKI